ncbi:hypothetical protein BC332_27054 [Capsicum chinense]|uniref:R3H domain-containing protein 2-like n=1 Tax=Capsicum annuum TaxID=4072 RepID=A0A1U8EKS6_CAPAN|nr:uncharacterized protein LOC107843996 [Capsicum annuum]KAF3665181.1 putative transcription factor LUX-like [Capsicum annuum]KAF3671966.1 putative transcription factor LUX-like [Capsicum annuum]PHT63425.1 hypothetical protein T459_32789 [Capsicum annuum]PHU06232.1 hypothetical protein BC332_27054 [Capsicum chinense]
MDSGSCAAYLTMVDPFLVEALQNPRHRLTILRMELDIQKFLQNSDMQQFEFPHFPTSYLRLAAHRVAQHYGLQTTVQDNVLDGQGAKILVTRKPESKYPAVRLSDVPPKQSDNDKYEKMKIVIQPRPSNTSAKDSESGAKRSQVRTVEERKEEYDRARARIFNSPINSESRDTLVRVTSDLKNTIDENECSSRLLLDMEKSLSIREGGTSSRVAIFRDREKELSDPDYDRNYVRYVKSVPSGQCFSVPPFDVQKFQPPYVHYDPGFAQLSQLPNGQASPNYRNPVLGPYHAMGFNQTSNDGVFMQWPTQSMIYAHSYDQVRHAFFQPAFCQQPLSFGYSQNHS